VIVAPLSRYFGMEKATTTGVTGGVGTSATFSPSSWLLVLATANPGKLVEMRKCFEYLSSQTQPISTNVTLVSPVELNLPPVIVVEDQMTLEGNAAKKAKAYFEAIHQFPNLLEEYCRKALPTKGNVRVGVIGDDSGLEIDELGGEPGTRVRRWKDGETEMADDEIVEYCLHRMKDIPKGKRQATFRSVVAFATSPEPKPDQKESLEEGPRIEYFEGQLKGSILEEPRGERIKGFPMERLFFIEEWEKLLGEIQLMPPEEKFRYPTQRQVALARLYERLAKDV
jgi:non-canonical purine NTP pyrophosphatase (RdgB/HAM1 family)